MKFLRTGSLSRANATSFACACAEPISFSKIIITGPCVEGGRQSQSAASAGRARPAAVAGWLYGHQHGHQTTSTTKPCTKLPSPAPGGRSTRGTSAKLHPKLRFQGRQRARGSPQGNIELRPFTLPLKARVKPNFWCNFSEMSKGGNQLPTAFCRPVSNRTCRSSLRFEPLRMIMLERPTELGWNGLRRQPLRQFIVIPTQNCKPLPHLRFEDVFREKPHNGKEGRLIHESDATCDGSLTSTLFLVTGICGICLVLVCIQRSRALSDKGQFRRRCVTLGL